MNSNRLSLLLDILENEKTYVSSAFLSRKIHVCSKTILNDIKALNCLMNNYAVIYCERNKGLKLHIIDDERYKMLKKETNHNKSLVIYNEDRNYYIIKHLIILKRLSSEKIKEKLSITDSMLNIIIKSLNDKMSVFSISIVKTNGYYTIRGNEINRRNFLTSFLITTNHFSTENIMDFYAYNDASFNNIDTFLSDCLRNHHYFLSDESYKNVTVYLLVSLMEMIRGNYIDEILKKSESKVSNEIIIASEILDYFKRKCGIKIKDEEKYYLALQLISSQKMIVFDDQNRDSVDYQEAYELIEQMLVVLDKLCKIDLKNQQEFYFNLTAHLIPMIKRIKEHIQCYNPLLSEIKINYPLAYNAAMISCSVIEEKLNQKVNEDEIGYLALIINLGMMKNKDAIKKKRLLIICASGRAGSKMLMYQIENRYQKYIEKMDISGINYLTSNEINSYDCVISTVPISEKFVILIPYVQVNNFLTGEDYKAIEKLIVGRSKKKEISDILPKELFFVDIASNTKDELIANIVERISEIRSIPKNFLKNIIRREEIGSTCFGNSVAIPHPLLPIGNESFVSTTILKRSVRWRNENVKLIFLISTGTNVHEDMHNFYRSLSNMMLNDKAIQEIIDKKDYDTMIKQFKKYGG